MNSLRYKIKYINSYEDLLQLRNEFKYSIDFIIHAKDKNPRKLRAYRMPHIELYELFNFNLFSFYVFRGCILSSIYKDPDGYFVRNIHFNAI